MSIFVFLSGEEADLVRASNQIVGAAECRAQEEQNKTGLVSPMICFETREQAKVVSEADALRESYREKCRAKELPILIPCDTTSVVPNGTFPSEFGLAKRSYQVGTTYHTFSRDTRKASELSHMEVADAVISRVALKCYNGNLYHYVNGCYNKLSDQDAITLIRCHADRELRLSGNAQQLENVLKLLRTDPRLRSVPLEEADSNVLCVGNGFVNLDTLALSMSSPNFFFTSRIEAEWHGAQPCPQFDNYVARVTGGDPILIKRLWQTIGYALVPDNKAKRFIVFQGVGDSGKSILGSLLESFFDASAVASVDIFKLKGRFATAELAGKRLNVSMDLPAECISEEAVGVLKKITGGDMLTVEEKYKSPRAERISCTLLFGTNHAVRIGAADEAFARRMLLIPFCFPVPKEQQDPYLLERLKAERSGILYRAVCAYNELCSNGYIFAGDDRYSFYTQMPEETIVSDGVAEFAKYCCVFDGVTFTASDQLFEAYASFCAAKRLNGLREKSLFSRRFAALYAGKISRDKQRVCGIPLNGYRGVTVHGGDAVC